VKNQQTFQRAAYLLGFAGAAFLTLLLIQQGAQDVIRAVAAAGWWLVAIAAFHLIPLGLDGTAWWMLFPERDRPHFRTVYWMRWLGESISNLIPAAQVGGDIIRARLAVLRGAPVSAATASVLVDITVSVFTQTFFTLLGWGLLIAATGRTNLMVPALAGAPIAIAAVAGFYVVQRLGMFRLCAAIISRWAKDPNWRSLAGKGGEIDQTLRNIYARQHVVAACCLCTMISWISGAGEVWIGFQALGIPASFDKAVILESVGQGVRSALFLVSGALGVHEGGYLVIKIAREMNRPLYLRLDRAGMSESVFEPVAMDPRLLLAAFWRVSELDAE
jgi:putative membrane protein